MHLQPEALFVVACPVCQGQVAATGSICGRDACCPLCANLFQVPFPPTAAAAARSEVATPSPAPGPATPGEDWGGVIEKLAPPRRQPDPGERPPADPDTFAPPETEPAPVARAAPPAADEPVPAVGGPPLAPGPDELAFREPVRTVRVGGEVVELRRLSPEERRARRIRRNLLLIVVGVSIMLAIVVLAGFRG